MRLNNIYKRTKQIDILYIGLSFFNRQVFSMEMPKFTFSQTKVK